MLLKVFPYKKNSKIFTKGWRRPKKFMMPWDERSLLRELRSNRFESLPEIMLSCKKKLNIGTSAKTWLMIMRNTNFPAL